MTDVFSRDIVKLRDINSLDYTDEVSITDDLIVGQDGALKRTTAGDVFDTANAAALEAVDELSDEIYSVLTGYVDTTSNQSIGGGKTFTGEVAVSAPINATNPTTKTYVDTHINNTSNPHSVTRTQLGATTVGGNLFTLTNPSATSFLRVNSDNTVSALIASSFRTAIGVGTISTQNSNDVSITGGNISGLTSISVPTAAVGTNTTTAASTAFVQTALDSTSFAEWALNNYNAGLTTGITFAPTLVSPTVYAGSGFSTSGFTVPAGQGGLYYVEVYGEIVGSGDNIAYAQIGLKKNSTDFFRRQQINFSTDSLLAFVQTLSSMIFLVEGDIIRPQFTAAFTSGTVTLQNASFLVHKMNSY